MRLEIMTFTYWNLMINFDYQWTNARIVHALTVKSNCEVEIWQFIVEAGIVLHHIIVVSRCDVNKFNRFILLSEQMNDSRSPFTNKVNGLHKIANFVKDNSEFCKENS